MEFKNGAATTTTKKMSKSTKFFLWKFCKMALAIVHTDDFWVYKEHQVVVFALIQNSSVRGILRNSHMKRY